MFKEDIERIGGNYIFNMIVKPFIQKQWIILTQMSKKTWFHDHKSLSIFHRLKKYGQFLEKLNKYKITNLPEL